MRRLLHAIAHSFRAARTLLGGEEAFRQEAVVLVLALPAAWWLAPTWRGFLLLVGAVLGVMVVEVVNTAVEAACDAISRDFRPEIRIAKDCGSLAVFIAIVIALGVWGLAVAEKLAGHPL